VPSGRGDTRRRERDRRRPRALQEEPDVVLVGHADAAVHLHRLVADEAERIGAAGLGDGGGAGHLRVVAPSSRTRCACITAERASSVSTNMRAARCLSAWNVPIGTPNCTRVLQVVERHVERGEHAAQHLRAERDRRRGRGRGRGGARPLATSPTTASRPTRTSFSVTFAALRASRRVTRRLDGDARRCRGGSRKSVNAARVVGPAAVGPRGDDEVIGDVAVEDVSFSPAEHPAVAAALRARRDVLWAVAATRLL
jgi:hypothetical protein